MIKEGSKAIRFELTDAYGRIVKLENFIGRFIVLYFYPKALTSGCTKEAEDMRDHYSEFKELNTEILAVSGDKKETLEKFIKKNNLPFTLLSDPDFKVCSQYDVYKEKSMYGRKYMGIERSTFLIDKNGTIQKVWRKVKVQGHVQEVLAELKKIA